MKFLLLFSLLMNLRLTIAIVNDDEPHSFRNFKLVRINPETMENLIYLKSLYEGSSPYELDFWQPPTSIGRVVDVTVAPSDAPIFVRDLESKKLNYIVAVNDLAQAIANEKSPEHYYHPETSGFSYERYNSLDEIHAEMKRLKKEKPNMVTLIDIGQSHENRTLLVIKVTGSRNPMGSKMSMWIDAGIHAREWIAPATAMYILHELMNNYETDPTVQKLLDHVEFYILPVMNPDGYEYSRTKNRMWRKNRRQAQCKRQHFHTVCCAGVDLNRNFDWFWASTGSSSDPCHETYHGPSAFSEPESQAVKDFLEENTPEAFITLHSYSQMWLIPYGHRKRSYPQDFQTALRPLAIRATKALYELYGTKYQVGTGADLMYEASGGSHDWAKGQLKVPYAYLVELRPKNSLMGHGFLLPEREIASTGLETFEAVKVVAEELVAQFVEPIIRSKLSSTGSPPMRRGYNLIDTTTTTTTTPRPTTQIELATETPETTTTAASTSTTSPTTSSSTTTTTTTTTTTPSATTTTTEEPTTTAIATTTSAEVPTTTDEAEVLSSTESFIIRPRVRPTSPPDIDESESLRCIDYGSYCRLWGILQLCDRLQVMQLCTKTCHRQCRV